jgi:hypothetical protein
MAEIALESRSADLSMVRSKDENRPKQELFYLVEQIRSEDKYFNVSLSELSQKLADDNYVEVTWEHETVDVDGTTIFTEAGAAGVQHRLNFTKFGSMASTGCQCLTHQMGQDAPVGIVTSGTTSSG